MHHRTDKTVYHIEYQYYTLCLSCDYMTKNASMKKGRGCGGKVVYRTEYQYDR